MASHLCFINKDLLECGRSLHLYIVHGCLCPTVAELSGYDGRPLLANILLSKKAGKTPMIPHTRAESLRAAPFPDSAMH